MRALMRMGLIIVGLLGAAQITGARAAAERYVFDPAHTNMLFFISHLGFSNMQGEFHSFDGGFVFDPDAPAESSVEATIATESVDMDHEKLNAHLQTDDFFAVERFPTMTFKSTRIEPTGEQTGRIHGDLTLLGVTKPVVLVATFNKAGVHPMNGNYVAGFSARGILNRSDFGMTYGLPAVGDEVTLVLEVEGIRQ